MNNGRRVCCSYCGLYLSSFCSYFLARPVMYKRWPKWLGFKSESGQCDKCSCNKQRNRQEHRMPWPTGLFWQSKCQVSVSLSRHCLHRTWASLIFQKSDSATRSNDAKCTCDSSSLSQNGHSESVAMSKQPNTTTTETIQSRSIHSTRIYTFFENANIRLCIESLPSTQGSTNQSTQKNTQDSKNCAQLDSAGCEITQTMKQALKDGECFSSWGRFARSFMSTKINSI